MSESLNSKHPTLTYRMIAPLFREGKSNPYGLIKYPTFINFVATGHDQKYVKIARIDQKN